MSVYTALQDARVRIRALEALVDECHEMEVRAKYDSGQVIAAMRDHAVRLEAQLAAAHRINTGWQADFAKLKEKLDAAESDAESYAVRASRAERENARLKRMVAKANQRLQGLIPLPCYDHDCREHAWWDEACDHSSCTHLFVNKEAD